MSTDHRFDVWAPHARKVTVRIEGEDHPMEGLCLLYTSDDADEAYDV